MTDGYFLPYTYPFISNVMNLWHHFSIGYKAIWQMIYLVISNFYVFVTSWFYWLQSHLTNDLPRYCEFYVFVTPWFYWLQSHLTNYLPRYFEWYVFVTSWFYCLQSHLTNDQSSGHEDSPVAPPLCLRMPCVSMFQIWFQMCTELKPMCTNRIVY